MTNKVELPDYKRKAYFVGDYTGFKYHTELLKEREKICFLSGKERRTPGASKLEMEYKKENDPNMGPGHYTPISSRYIDTIKKSKKPKTAPEPIAKRGSDSSECSLPLTPEVETVTIKVEKKKSKVAAKEGLLWGRRDVIKDRSQGPGPGETELTRYPENLNLKPNKVSFNSTTTYKVPLTITPIAPKSSADQYEHKDLFKSAFEATKELNVPIVICMRAYKDVCAKCKNEIDEQYFYYKSNVFICRKCYKESIVSRNVQERTKISAFKQGRYCTRYHRHHKVRGFDKLIPSKNLYHLLLREIYHQQYTGGRFINEGVPSKDKSKSSTKGSKIYQRLFPESTYAKGICTNAEFTMPIHEAFEQTFKSTRQFELSSGVKHKCVLCKPAPVFFLPQGRSNLSILNMT